MGNKEKCKQGVAMRRQMLQEREWKRGFKWSSEKRVKKYSVRVG